MQLLKKVRSKMIMGDQTLYIYLDMHLFFEPAINSQEFT